MDESRNNRLQIFLVLMPIEIQNCPDCPDKSYLTAAAFWNTFYLPSMACTLKAQHQTAHKGATFTFFPLFLFWTSFLKKRTKFKQTIAIPTHDSIHLQMQFHFFWLVEASLLIDWCIFAWSSHLLLYQWYNLFCGNVWNWALQELCWELFNNLKLQ